MSELIPVSPRSTLEMSAEEFAKAVREACRPPPVPIPVIRRNALEMTAEEFAAELRRLGVHRWL